MTASGLRVAGFLASAVSVFLYVQANDFPPSLQAWGMGIAALLMLPGLALCHFPASLILFCVTFAASAVSGLPGGVWHEPLFRLLSVWVIAASAAPLLAGPRAFPRACLWRWVSLAAILYLWTWSEGPQGVHGFPFGNANLAGGFFVGPVVFGVALLAERGLKREILWIPGLGVILALMALVASDSQSAWLATGAGIALAVFLRLSGRSRWALGAFLAALLVAAAVWIWGALPGHPLRSSWEYLRYETSTGARLLFWEGAVRAFLDAPVLGHGPGSFPFVFSRFRAEDHFASAAVGLWEPNAHNLFLDLLVETGLVGFLAFLWVYLSAVRAGLGSGNPVRRAAAIATLVILVNGMASIAPSLPQGQFLFWVFLAVSGGWGKEEEARDQELGVGTHPPLTPHPSPLTPFRKVVIAGLALVWMKASVCDRGEWLLAAARGHLAAREGSATGAAAHLETAVARMEKAGEKSPLLPNTLLALANARAAGGDPIGALEACRAARRFCGAFPVFDLMEGRVRASLGDREGAARRYAAYAGVRLFDRALFADDLWANTDRGRAPPGYWDPFLEPLARARKIRRWDLEIASMYAILQAEAGYAGEAAAARAAADAVYAAAEALQDARGIVAYARLVYPTDRVRAEAILVRWEAARGTGPEVSMFLNGIRKSGR